MKSEKLEKDALVAIGVRSIGIDDLVVAINEWLVETTETSSSPIVGVKDSSSNGDDESSQKMVFHSDPFQPAEAWAHFVYRQQKKTGMASWESSYDRFMEGGEHPQTIAMSPVNGRPIQVNTVLNHVFQGALSGRSIDFQRIATISTPPTQNEWDALTKLEAETGMSVTGDPKTSGIGGDSFRMTDFLSPIMGEGFASKEYADRTEEENAKFGMWCGLLQWYLTMRRIGYIPEFGEAKLEKNDWEV